MNKILSVQYLRGIAALTVVIFHGLGGPEGPFKVGAVGVDIFFIISGFIMYVVTERENTPGIFLWKRLARIIPLYWLVTLLTAAICLSRPYLIWGVDTSLSHVMHSLLFLPHINNIGKNIPTVTQGWTLNLEMYFYFMFAATLLYPRPIQIYCITALFVFLVIMGVSLSPPTGIMKTYTSPLLLEFIAGLWLGYFWVNKKLPSNIVGIILSLSGIGILFILQILPIPDLTEMRCLYLGIPAMLIVLGALSIEAAGSIMELRLPRIIGDASYSIYLMHAMIQPIILNHLSSPMFMKVLIELVVITTISILVFYWVEMPMNKLGKKSLGNKKAEAAAISIN